MPGRKYSATNEYRYGFNEKENDIEINGLGNQIDFGDRIYDPRLGRFISLDPLMKKYADMSPYGYSKNNPIYFVDISGRDVGVSIDKVNGTITFSNTIYLVGKTIKTPSELQKDFDKNVKSHMTGTPYWRKSSIG